MAYLLAKLYECQPRVTASFALFGRNGHSGAATSECLIRQKAPPSLGRSLQQYIDTTLNHVCQLRPVPARDVVALVHGALRNRGEMRGRSRTGSLARRFHLPRCGQKKHGLFYGRHLKRHQCRHCRHQTTLTAGTIMEATKLPLTT